MVDSIGEIDLDHKRLVCSTKDIAKLSSSTGCQLNIVTEKVLKMADDEDDDDDSLCSELNDASGLEEVLDLDQRDYGTPEQEKARERSIQREFITLVLNANRDPVKPGTKFKFKEFQEGIGSDGEVRCDIRNLEHGFTGIHRQYYDIGIYDDYMATHRFQEVSAGRVFKLTRVAGFQLPVTEETLVIYNCAFWTQGFQEPFDSTWLRRTTITTHLATDSILPGLRELLLTSNQGELCEAFIRPEAAFGRLGVKPRIPANATIFCLLEVVRVVTRSKYEMITTRQVEDRPCLMFEDLYDAADEARRRGNYYFEQKQYRTALLRYKSAIKLIESIAYKDDSEEDKADELLVRLFNNCARTANAIGNPRLALAACKQARMINDREPKTYWHRMTAWSMKGHTDRALGVARRAMQLFAQDGFTVRAFQRAADEFKLKMQKDKEDLDELNRLMSQALVSAA